MKVHIRHKHETVHKQSSCDCPCVCTGMLNTLLRIALSSSDLGEIFSCKTTQQTCILQSKVVSAYIASMVPRSPNK